MKNFKKISRKELKSLVGGKLYLGDGGLSSGGENTYKCCTDLYTCGSCSTSSNCQSGQFLKAC